MKRWKMSRPTLCLLVLWVSAVFVQGDSRNRERIEVILEELEGQVLELEEELLRRQQPPRWQQDPITDYSEIAVDTGGLPRAEVEAILHENGFRLVSQHPSLPNIFLAARIGYRSREKREMRSWEGFESRFEWVEPLARLAVVKRANELGKWNDPHFSRQAEQFDTMGFTKAWELGLTGKGVRIAVVDDGVSFTASPELTSTTHDRIPAEMFGMEPADGENYRHGTLCASVIAMKGNNSECGVGAAPGATIVDTPLLTRVTTDYSESVAMAQQADIFTCSWGPPDDGISALGPLTLAQKVISGQAEKGRSGLGSLFVWAAGNGGKTFDDCALDGFVSNPNIIGVSWSNLNGTAPPDSEGCPAILTSVVADNLGEQVSVDSRGQCSPAFYGSSAAAPVVAAGLAILLEKYPKLTRRQINHLIVHGANAEHYQKFAASDWTKNAAGLNFNRLLGFGVFSVERMLALVSSLANPAPEHLQCVKRFQIQDGSNTFGELAAQLSVKSCDVKYLEHLEVGVTLVHPRRGDIRIRLRSPAGTWVTALERRPLDTTSTGLEWNFTISHFWGEDPTGDWVIEFDDKLPSKKRGKILAVSLILHGTIQPSFSKAKQFSLDEAAAGRSSHSWLLAMLFLVLFSLVVYGGLEYLGIQRRIRRSESSWRILEEADEGEEEAREEIDMAEA